MCSCPRGGHRPTAFAQDSISPSVRRAIRGMHVRSGAGEAKLVLCSYRPIFDIMPQAVSLSTVSWSADSRA
jgi:hypothetical protein